MLVDVDKVAMLVTGGAGFMGSCFIRHLLSRPSFEGKIINYDALTYAGNLANVAVCEQDPRYFFCRGDILDAALFEKVLKQHKVQAVVHFAAETHVDRSIHEALSFVRTNSLGTATLLEVLRKYPGVHFHHVSTDEVYGSLGEVGSFHETSPYLPNSPYAASKASSDHLVRAYGETYGLSVTISHAGNNYGPHQYPEKLIPLMILRLLQNKPLPLYGKGDQRRDWLYVEDHARAIEAILRKGEKKEVYNIGAGEEVSNLTLVKMLIEEYSLLQGKDFKEFEKNIIFIADRPGHDFRYAMDTQKIQKQLKWHPRYRLREGIRETLFWYLDNPKWLIHAEDIGYQSFIQSHYGACP